MNRGRKRRALLAGLAVLLLAGAALAAADGLGAFSPSPAEIAAQRAAARAAAQARARARLLARETSVVTAAERRVAVALPKQEGAAAPAAPAALFKVPASPHLVLGFAPYWALAGLTPADFADTSVVAYYGIAANPDGSLDQRGPGWADFSGSGFAAFVSTAHRAGDRVLLTVSDETASSISTLLGHPAASAERLATALGPLLVEDGLDGVDLDIEGRSFAERGAFVTFVSTFSRRFRAMDPKGELVLDTYPQSASASPGFFDVAALGPLVDQLFIMGYDMQSSDTASADAPLASPSLALSDVQAVLQYEKVLPPTELLLGMPFYGYDFTTLDGSPGSPLVGSDPVAVDYSAIVGVGRKARWDPGSLTPYTVFRRGKQDHQTWYDDPVSLALKTALAEREGLAGVGAWALGAEGGAAAMLEALDGGARPEKLPLVPAP